MGMGFENCGVMGGFGMILFWGLIIAFVVWVIRSNQSITGRQSSNKSLDILKQRYASGEIDKEEYESKHRDLTP